jgi:phage terminase large subunit-like protein
MNNSPYSDISKVRREMARKSFKFFISTYFKHYTKLPFAAYHLEIIDYLEKMTFERSRKVAWAAPRGNAKSSIVTTMYVLWCICYKYETCIVIFSATKDQSEKLVGQIKDELSSNELLLEDFPDVCELPNPRWRAGEIITKNGVNVIASSTGHRIRGIRYKNNRPGLVILDDAETKENTQTQESRDKIHSWFPVVVMNLGSKKTNYVAIGTILHIDSLLAKITSKEVFPGFDTTVFKSVIRFADRKDLWDIWALIYAGKEFYGGLTGPDTARRYFEDNKNEMLKGAEVLWPEHESYFDLMVLREQIGSYSFDSEKMNEPKDLTSYSVDEKALSFWETDQITTAEDLRRALGGGIPVAAVDPSTGKGKDYSAIVGAVFFNGKIYVTEVDVGRWGLTDLVKRICLHQQEGKYAVFAYEANGPQIWVGDALKEESVLVPAKPIVNTAKAPKEARIMKTMLLLQQGKIIISRRYRELVRQITNYPNVANDDILDALALITAIVEDIPQERIEKLKGALKELTILKHLGFPKTGMDSRKRLS